MKKHIIAKLVIVITSFIGMNKASGNATEEIETAVSAKEVDLTSNLDAQSADFEKTYFYQDDVLAEDTILFLKTRKIPFGLKYFDKGLTAISIKKIDDLTLSTQRWGSSARSTKE